MMPIFGTAAFTARMARLQRLSGRQDSSPSTGFEIGRHHREQGDSRHAELCGFAGGIDQRLDGQTLDARHGGHRLSRTRTFLDKDRPDEIFDG